MNLLKITWRNLWRNKKRTLITMAAVFLAVFLSTFMSSMQEGTYSQMIDNVVKFYSGYIQIHDSSYWESKSINDLYEPNNNIENAIITTQGITNSSQRLESFSLISSGEHTKGAALIGIDPIKEDEITNLTHWVDSGNYLTPNDDGILLAVNIAKYLKADIGDTLVLLSQGYHGATAADLFPVRGFLKFASPDLNNYAAYITLEKAQEFFSAPDMVSSTILMVDNYNRVNKIKQELDEKLDDEFSSMTWDEMQPEVVSMIEGDKSGALVFKAILYLLIGFIIFGTIIMMINERLKELAITIAVGMQKYKMQLILFLETVYIGLLGVATGFALTMPIIFYLVQHPIPLPDSMAEAYETYGIEAAMYFSIDYKVFLNQLISVFAITIAVSLYPILRVQFIKLIEALRS